LLLTLLAGTLLRLWYAAYEPTEKRFWDERYNFENVESILETGSLRPAKVYYPSPLVSWPQAGLLAASDGLARMTGVEALAIRSGSGFSPTAYFLCRLFSVLYGVASLWVLFLIGRLVFDERVGLLATVALTFLPWHIHISGKFKPDAFVVLTVLIAFYWCLRAVRAPSAKSYALAGFGIALALSSKLTGGVVAVPLVVGSLVWSKGSEEGSGSAGAGLGRLGLVALAGVTSVVTFLAMNPYGRWYLGFLSGLQRDYAMRAEWVEMTRWAIPPRAVGYLLGDFVHGPVVGALALAGGALLAMRLLRRCVEGVEVAYFSMLLVFPPAFIAAYTVATPYFKGNNFLPIVPFTCLLAAWAAFEAWRTLPSGRRGAWIGAALVAVALFLPGWLYVYRSLVPTGVDVARQILLHETRPTDERFFYVEPDPSAEPPWEGRAELFRSYPGFRAEGELAGVAERALDLSDGELFPEDRLNADGGELYRRRVERVAKSSRRVLEPRLFRVRRPSAVLVVHPWALESRQTLEPRGRCKPGRNCFRLGEPDGSERASDLSSGAEEPRLASLALTLPAPALTPGQDELGLEVHGQRLSTVRTVVHGTARRFLTERFRHAGDELEVRLMGVEPRLLHRVVAFELMTWLPESELNGVGVS
jgi:4-amino-4-deoxy-L-arabinose transferase-like glycosyltransferase